MFWEPIVQKLETAQHKGKTESAHYCAQAIILKSQAARHHRRELHTVYTSYTVAAPNSNDSAIGMRKSGPTILPVRTVHGVCCDKFDIIQSFATPKELVTQLLNHFQVEFRLDFDRAVSL